MRETSAFVAAQIDWKEMSEAHIFKADVPRLKNGEVKVEVEEGTMENDVLTVTIHKEEVKKLEMKAIQISS
nr:17.9 kDa class I heat shock protein [Ipomoea trifida]